MFKDEFEKSVQTLKNETCIQTFYKYDRRLPLLPSLLVPFLNMSVLPTFNILVGYCILSYIMFQNNIF